jgi:hypothetical protein
MAKNRITGTKKTAKAFFGTWSILIISKILLQYKEKA